MDFARGETYFHSANAPEVPPRLRKSTKPVIRDLTEDLILHRDIYGMAGCWIFRSAKFAQYNRGLDIYPSREGQNYQLLLPMAVNSPAGYVAKPVINYLVRDDSHSYTQRSFEQKCERWQELGNIVTITLNKLDMPEEQRNYLLKLFADKVQRKVAGFKRKALIARIKSWFGFGK